MQKYLKGTEGVNCGLNKKRGHQNSTQFAREHKYAGWQHETFTHFGRGHHKSGNY